MSNHISIRIGGHTVLVDADVWKDVSHWVWHVIPQSKHRSKFRVRGYPKGRSNKREYLHRIVLAVTDPSIDVDHINGNPLDNRRCNLRMLDRVSNQANRGKNRNNTTGYKGVIKSRKTFRAQLSKEGYHWTAGPFETAEDAARAYDRKAREVWGGVAYLNFP